MLNHCTFSIRYMADNDAWGDSVMIKTLSVLFALRVTVVSAQGPREFPFRHQKPLEEADLILIFNGASQGHYSACCKYTNRSKYEIMCWFSFLLVKVDSFVVRNDNTLVECAKVQPCPQHESDDESEPHPADPYEGETEPTHFPRPRRHSASSTDTPAKKRVSGKRTQK